MLHSREDGTLTGFHLSETGALNAKAGSQRILGDSSINPVQASLALKGKISAVTLKDKNKIPAFPVSDTGIIGTAFQANRRWEYPNGFALSSNGTLYATEDKIGSLIVYKNLINKKYELGKHCHDNIWRKLWNWKSNKTVIANGRQYSLQFRYNTA